MHLHTGRGVNLRHSVQIHLSYTGRCTGSVKTTYSSYDGFFSGAFCVCELLSYVFFFFYRKA